MFSKFFVATGLSIAFIAWAAYHYFIKKDLKKHLDDFYAGLFFIGVWVLIAWLVFR